MGNGLAIVFVLGNVFGRLLNPYATAASSIMSHSCRISGRVAGTWTMSSSSAVAETEALNDIRVRSLAISEEDRAGENPVAELM